MPDIIREYDKNGKLIHHKTSDGFETWHEYDANGNCIYTKHLFPHGYEVWQNGKMKNSTGVE